MIPCKKMSLESSSNGGKETPKKFLCLMLTTKSVQNQLLIGCPKFSHRLLKKTKLVLCLVGPFFENLALFRDVLDHVNTTNETSILASLDQEKAFDCVDHTFFCRTLEHFGFGPSFLRWISTLYHGVSKKIIVNGFLTEKMFPKRGVRQGDSLSPLLYVICAEVLVQNVRNHTGIQGFLLPGANSYLKIRQYADESTCFVKDTFLLQNLFYLLRKYARGTGAKLNLSKTEAMWLGA